MQKLTLVLAQLAGLGTLAAAVAAADLESGWENPPASARLRAYWWWLNGQVTKESITRDLAEMKAKGFGGALICDANGAAQDGNEKVPPGPTFLSPAWRELYKHALREADRLGLEMSLNIQSGWNLGGPMVTADDAAKKLTWSETRVSGPAKIDKTLPSPKSRDNYYRDLFVVAWRLPDGAPAASSFAGITSSSEQSGQSIKRAADGDPETYWVSRGAEPGAGPTRQRPEWVQLNFSASVTATQATVLGRPGYGPRECELQASADGQTFRSLKAFTAPEKSGANIAFPAAKAAHFRLLIYSSYDPKFPQSPRNAQLAEFSLAGPEGAWPGGGGSARRPIQNWEQKAMHRTLHFSAPDTTPLLVDFPAQPGEEDVKSSAVLDLTSHLEAGGRLRWEAPEGAWQILRFGCTIGDHSRVSTSSDGWQGYALDPLDTGAFRRYWDAVVEPLIADAGPLAGRALKYLHTDSWEVEAINWTPTLREEFRRRRGYDFLPFLPALAGRIVDSRPESNKFLNDFRKTLGDLAVDNHFKPFAEWSHRRGLQFHPESGGPHAVPIDAQRCLGQNDVPMSEFWAWSWRHRVGDANRFFLKQPASAAHTYGRKLVAAEGFTTIGPHWQETLWDNLKPSFEQALCEGMNLLVWHAFVCSPKEFGLPGIQYFAGTHFNPNTTWWEKSGPFLAYINRCQFLLQQGLFVADALHYYGDHVPNFAQLKRSDPARVLPGYDYDVGTEEVLLTRLSVKDGRLALPDGMSYRLLTLPERPAISLPVLRKLKELVEASATVIGPKPAEPMSLQDYPRAQQELAQLADALWGPGNPAAPLTRPVGRGRVIWGRTAREVLLADGVKPDFEWTDGDAQTALDYIHRRDGEADIYFVANRSNRWEEVRCAFRVTGRAPEIWEPVSGLHRIAAAYQINDQEGRTTLPLQFPPFGSCFVVFRSPAAAHPPAARLNHPRWEPRLDLAGAWTVKFDPAWGGPAVVQFPELTDWSKHADPAIRFYSGAATYEKKFDWPGAAAGRRIWLDLGEVRQLAEIRLNGRHLGIAWAKPFGVDLTDALRSGANTLEIEVVNFWPNRLIGDQSLPAEKRLTRTNVRKLTKDTPLMESGLLGPVRILEGLVP